MLNEIYAMHQGLKSVNKEIVIKHNDIREPGVGVTFRIVLNVDGNVVSVHSMTPQEIKETWSIGDGNKNQFPAVKLTFPLLGEKHIDYRNCINKFLLEKKITEENYRELILELSNRFVFKMFQGKSKWPDYRENIIKRHKTLMPLKGNDGYPIFELFNRYLKSGKNGINIIEQTCHYLIEKSLTIANKSELKIIADILFGDQLDSKGFIPSGKRVTFLIDCKASDDVDYYSSSKRFVHYLSNELFLLDSRSFNKVSSKYCSLLGRNEPLVTKKYPSTKLPIIGNTILLTKNSDTSGDTVKRYNKSESESYPLSKKLSDELSASLTSLTSAQQEYKTWSKITPSIKKTSSLLLAYCQNLNFTVIPLITGRQLNTEIEDFDDYKQATETVFKIYKGSDLKIDQSVNIIEVISLDKANRKIYYSTTSSINNLKDASKRWLTACEQTPDVRLLIELKNEDNKKISKCASPMKLAPEQIVRLFQKKYVSSGQRSNSVYTFSFSDAMNLFLSRTDSVCSLARRSLSKFIDQYEALLESCALNKCRNEKMNKANNAEALKAVTVISILLYKSDRNKEQYMNDFPYQLGQLCSAMDELHVGYCHAVRSGQVPSSLIGNTAYGLALQNPVKALEFLSLRLKPYQAWAIKKISDDDKTTGKFDSNKFIKSGLFAYRWISDESKQLQYYFKNHDLKVNELYKAELMLGYLSGRPYDSKNDNSKSDNSKSDFIIKST